MKSAVLELTYKCNLICAFCYCAWHDHPEAFGDEISTNEWENICDRCIRAGVSSFTITGGEPVLYDGAERIVRRLVSNRCVNECELYTNLRVVPDWIMDVNDACRFRITTSLQGIYNRASVIGDSWSFDAWRKNCRRLIDSGVRIGVAITVTKQNLNDLEQMIHLVDDLGIPRTWVNTMVIEGRGIRHPELWLTADSIYMVYERARLMQRQVTAEILLPGEYYCSCRPDGIVPEGFDRAECNRCAIEQEMLVIGPDGRRRKCMHVW